MSNIKEDFDVAKSSTSDEDGSNLDRPSQGAKNADRIIGLALLAVCGVLFWQTLSFPVTTWAPLGLAFWPRLLIAALTLVGAILVFRGRLDESPVSNLDWRAFVALAAAVVYVVAMDRVGFVIATPFFLFASVVLLDPSLKIRRLAEALVFAVVGTVGAYLLFDRLLQIGLPSGA